MKGRHLASSDIYDRTHCLLLSIHQSNNCKTIISILLPVNHYNYLDHALNNPIMSPTPSSTFAPCSNHDSKDSRDEGSRVPSLRSMTSEEQLAQEARAIDLRRLQKTKDLVDYTILRHTLYAEQVEAAEPSVHRETVQKNEKTIHGDCKFFDPDFQWGIMAGENVGEPGKENSKMSDL
jgi:hypothetical protein